VLVVGHGGVVTTGVGTELPQPGPIIKVATTRSATGKPIFKKIFFMFYLFKD
jgi:hypothetical protein